MNLERKIYYSIKMPGIPNNNMIQFSDKSKEEFENWKQHICKICIDAAKFLSHELPRLLPLNCKRAIVFDIDDTILSHFGCIQPVLDLYNYATKILNFEPVIITNRPGTPQGIKYTKKQLLKCNIDPLPRLLYFRNVEVANDPWKYKEAARKDVHVRGYTIIMSVGDQPWDMGEYGGAGVRIPLFRNKESRYHMKF